LAAGLVSRELGGDMFAGLVARLRPAPYRRVGCQGQRLTGVLALRVILGRESVGVAL